MHASSPQVFSGAVRPPRLVVGRERERATLRRQLSDAMSGHGALTLVGGDAGIGKTTLARWLVGTANEGGTLVLGGGCYDAATTPPYGPWLEAFAGYRPTGDMPPLPNMLGDPDALARAESQAEIFSVVREFLATLTSRIPLLLLLEDLHWADQASLELLRAVARHVPSLSILLLITYRADELTRRHPLERLLPVLVRESAAESLNLQALGTPALRDLVEALYRLVAPDLDRLGGYLQRHTEGNPFFAREVLRALEEGGVLTRDEDGWRVGTLTHLPVPTLVRQVIDGRLERLDDATRRLLHAAAVIGQVVPLDVWQQVGAAADEQLDAAAAEALEARLLEDDPQGSGVRFPHALIREALYLSVPPIRRRGYHRRAAEALAAQRRAAPELVADHFARAGDPRAAGWLLSAGEHALALHAPRGAITRLTRALELPGQLGAARALRAYRRRVPELAHGRSGRHK